MTAPHFHSLEVCALVRDPGDARVVTLAVPAGLQETFAFVAGQHLTLRAWIDGQEVRRSYSICSAPGEPLRVAVRRVPGGVFSEWLHRALQVGDRLDVMPPEGQFAAVLRRRTPRHVLLVAGGSGITPMMSIIPAVLAARPDSRCTLLYGNRRVASTMFLQELDDLKNRHLTRLAVHHVFSRETLDIPLQEGRLDAARLAVLMRLCGPVDEAFVCGPHAWNDELEAALRGLGLAASQVHVERFGLPPDVRDTAVQPAPSGDTAQAAVTLWRDGRAFSFPYAASDGHLLAAAARAGLDLPYSCRSGVCATCRARVLQGEVRMTRNFALEPADVQAGFVLTCQAQPVSDAVTVSFDER